MLTLISFVDLNRQTEVWKKLKKAHHHFKSPTVSIEHWKPQFLTSSFFICLTVENNRIETFGVILPLYFFHLSVQFLLLTNIRKHFPSCLFSFPLFSPNPKGCSLSLNDFNNTGVTTCRYTAKSFLCILLWHSINYFYVCLTYLNYLAGDLLCKSAISWSFSRSYCFS